MKSSTFSTLTAFGILLQCLGMATLLNAAPPYTIGPATLPAMTTGVSYNATLTATGGTAPYTWIQLGMPGGLTLSSSGIISGTPSAPGNNVVYAQATDANNVVCKHAWEVKIAAGTGSSSSGSTGSSGSGSSGSSGSSNPYQYTLTVANGTIQGGSTSATITAGASVTIVANPPPPGQAFQMWQGVVALSNNNPTASTATFTMPYNNVLETAVYYTPPALVQPVTGHPRMWLKPADVARVQNWATSTNAVYQNGLLPALSNSVAAYNMCFPNGQPSSPYQDNGDIYGYAGPNLVSGYIVSEQHELLLAFFGLIHPNLALRVQYAQMARQLLMYEMNQAALGHATGVPFRDPLFAIYNRANAIGESWPLIVDWLQGVVDGNGNPVTILSAQDKATIRSVFLMWANDDLNAFYGCSPVGFMNSTALLPGGNAARIASNNYYSNHARLMAMMPLALDAADDPPLNANVPAGALGNSLRSFIYDATGAWLYQQYAVYADPATVQATFGLPAGGSLGLSSGGLPVEGCLYGHSYAFVLGGLLALQTAGYNNPTLSGPQIAMIGAPVWDRYVKGYISNMVNTAAVPPSETYLGPVYEMASYGDQLRIHVTPDFMQGYAMLALTEQSQGLTTHLNEARWFAMNATDGGAGYMLQRIQRPWSNTESILYFLLFDPSAPPPTDPRPGYPTIFYDAPQARLIRRTDWTPNATLFTYRSAPESINHENGDCGQFELWRKGEWLTKEYSNYDNNNNGQSTMWHNTLALQNWCAAGTPTLNPFEVPFYQNGSTFNNGMSAGDPVSISSNGSTYSYVQSDNTLLYNRPNVFTPSAGLMDIQHASRSILYLPNDDVVVYDRATTGHTGLFKQFNLNFTTTPQIDNTHLVVTDTTPGGQNLFLQCLLPTTASISWVPEAGSLTNVAELEPSIGRIVEQDPGNPADERFLHVLQAGDPGSAMAPATLVQSSAGSSLDGAQFGSTLVLFARSITTPFQGTVYVAPAAATTHYITGLAPNTGYNVTEQAAAQGAVQITIAAGGSYMTDAGGVLVFLP